MMDLGLFLLRGRKGLRSMERRGGGISESNSV
jgi:hypothetical protein